MLNENKKKIQFSSDEADYLWLKITNQSDVRQIVDIEIVCGQRILQSNRRFAHLNLGDVTISLVEYHAHETRLTVRGK